MLLLFSPYCLYTNILSSRSPFQGFRVLGLELGLGIGLEFSVAVTLQTIFHNHHQMFPLFGVTESVGPVFSAL